MLKKQEAFDPAVLALICVTGFGAGVEGANNASKGSCGSPLQGHAQVSLQAPAADACCALWCPALANHLCNLLAKPSA